MMRGLLLLILLASSRSHDWSYTNPLREVIHYPEKIAIENTDQDILGKVFEKPENFGKTIDNPDQDQIFGIFGKPEDFEKTTENPDPNQIFGIFGKPEDFGKTIENPDQDILVEVFGKPEDFGKRIEYHNRINLFSAFGNSETTENPTQDQLFGIFGNPDDFGKTTANPNQDQLFGVFGNPDDFGKTTENPNQDQLFGIFGNPDDFGKTTENPNQDQLFGVFGNRADFGKTTENPNQDELFGIFWNLTTEPSTHFLTSSISPTSGDVVPNENECLLEGNRKGVCVFYDQCDMEKLTDDLNGQSISDYDVDGLYNCLKPKHVCCPKEDIDPPETTVDPSLCGMANPQGLGMRMDDTKPTIYGEFPWMLAILRNKDKNQDCLSNKYTFVGAASLIGPRAAITAAHVIFTNLRNRIPLKVRAGDWNTQSCNDSLPHVDSAVIDASIHEDFDPSMLWNNIAVLLLDTPLEPTSHIGYACLPPQGIVPPVGEGCYSTGWGSVMEKSLMKTIGVERCEAGLRTSGIYRTNYDVHKSLMCAGGGQNRETCGKIMGSPLVCPFPDSIKRYTQHGIGFECFAQQPALYVNVALFRDWIDEQMKIAKLNTTTYSY